MGQLKQVAITYITHRWIMLILAVWLVLIVAPQFMMAFAPRSSASDRVPLVLVTIGLPLFFAPGLLVAQAKAQFAHSRRVLIPGFVGPHLTVVATLLVLLAIVYPQFVALALGFRPLGMAALAVAIAAPFIWMIQTNQFLYLFVGMVPFFSLMSPVATSWWLLDGPLREFPLREPIQLAIFVTGLGLLAGWVWRLAQLREEMDDYQTLVQWQMARKSGMEVTEQRRIVAEQFRRNKLIAWTTDSWLNRVGGYHGGRPYAIARLMRYGFGQPMEIQAVMMTTMFFIMTFFMTRYGFQTKGPGGAGNNMMFLMFAMVFPGFLPSEMLAQRRPRIAVDWLKPLSRRQLIDGLLTSVAWNSAVMWICMNAGVSLQLYLFVPQDQVTLSYVATLLLLSASVTLAGSATAMRTAVWTSQIKRLVMIWLASMFFVIPVIGWQMGRAKHGDALFAIFAAGLIVYAVWMFIRARRAWMNAELG